MWDLIKSLFPLILLLSFCACVATALLVTTGIVYVLAAIGLGAIGYLVLPVSVFVAIVLWLWIARYLFRNVTER
jgi:hypothetical protein